MYAAGIIERFDNSILIVTRSDPKDPNRCWLFPRCPVADDESPEAAMRRLGREQLGVFVEIVVGQPPILAELEQGTVELRYFFCGISSGEPDARGYRELRWILRGQMSEYDFDTLSAPVADWLMQTR